MMTDTEQNLKDKLTPEVLNALYEYAYNDVTYWDVFDLIRDLYKLLDVREPWIDITEEDKLDRAANYFESINKAFEKERELKQKKIIDEKQKLTNSIQNFEL